MPESLTNHFILFLRMLAVLVYISNLNTIYNIQVPCQFLPTTGAEACVFSIDRSAAVWAKRIGLLSIGVYPYIPDLPGGAKSEGFCDLTFTLVSKNEKVTRDEFYTGVVQLTENIQSWDSYLEHLDL